MERAHRQADVVRAASARAVVAVLMLATATATLYEGSPCFHESSQTRGVCKLLPYCSWAIKERRSQLYPQTCSFDGYMPVVCCPYTQTHDPPHLPLRPPLILASPMSPTGLSGTMEDTTEGPLRPLDPDIGGPLGPLPTSQVSTVANNAPDDLQLQVGQLDRLQLPQTVTPAVMTTVVTTEEVYTVPPPEQTPSETPSETPQLQLGDGYAAFLLTHHHG